MHAFGRRVVVLCGAAADVGEGGDGWVAAQLVQAAAAGGPDAADRDTQPGADIGVRQGRILEQQEDQLLARGRQIAKRLAVGVKQVIGDCPGAAVDEKNWVLWHCSVQSVALSYTTRTRAT